MPTPQLRTNSRSRPWTSKTARTMHVRRTTATVVEHEVVIVYTDIEAPTATAFAMVDGQMLG